MNTITDNVGSVRYFVNANLYSFSMKYLREPYKKLLGAFGAKK